MPKVGVKGVNWYYEWEGQGPSIVLLHGMGDNSTMWFNQKKAFTRDNLLVLADIKGHGSADRPKEGYEIPRLAEELAEWWKWTKTYIAADMEAHSDMVNIMKPPVFLGFSMGGRIALQCAINHPEIFKGLVLANSGVGLTPPSPEAQKRREEMMALLQNGDTKKWAEMATTGALSPGFKEKNPKMFEAFMKVKLQQKADAMLRVMQAMATPTPPPDLSQLKVPVLIIAGEHDTGMGPEQAKQVQAAIPGSKLVVLPTGHAAAIEAPEQFNAAVMEFVKSLGY
ncbi:MAG: alpha/beta hydrolase [Chloroflexota bacterium]